MDIIRLMAKDRKDTSQYLLRMSPEVKASLQAKSEAAGIPLSEAFRVGADRYLSDLLDEPQKNNDDVDDLLAEFHAAAARVERRLRGR